MGSGDRRSDVALFFSQKSGDPPAEFLLLVQITVQDCMNASSRDVSPLCQLHAGFIVDLRPTAFPLAGQSLDLRPPMVFLGVRCLPRSFGLLERVETTSEQFSQTERSS